MADETALGNLAERLRPVVRVARVATVRTLWKDRPMSPQRVYRIDSCRDLQDANSATYAGPNAVFFDTADLLGNLTRFGMRALKGVRRYEPDKIGSNLIIATGWFLSTLNRMGVDLDDAVWQRFPYRCGYCRSCVCMCSGTPAAACSESHERPVTLAEVQAMFRHIYPPELRSIEDAGIHMAEEIGEFQEAVLLYRGRHDSSDLVNLRDEAADVLSCLFGVWISMNRDAAAELREAYAYGCHACREAPCGCSYERISMYES